MNNQSQPKIILWAFYGSGKSTLANGTSIVDLDSVYYRFTNVESNPHDPTNRKMVKGIRTQRNPNYPENYIQAVRDLDADVILVNCDIPVLEKLENVVLYYPDLSLKQEYLKRYQKRGDHLSFIHMIEQDYEDMIRSLGRLPYPKFVAHEKTEYLSDVFQGGKIDMSQFMIKKDLSNLIERAREFDIQGYGFFSDYESFSGDEIAQQIFEGEIKLSIEELQEKVSKKQIEYENSFKGIYVYEDDKKIQVVQVVRGGGNQTDEIWVRERKGNPDEKFQYYGFRIFDKDGVIPENFERFQKLLKNGYQKTDERFEVGTIEKTDMEGYSFEEAVNLVMDAIACGVIEAEHGEVAPYSYGFNYRLDGILSYDSYESSSYGRYKGPFDAPKTIVRNHQLGKYPSLSFTQLEELVQQKQKELETVKITPYESTEEYYYHKKNPRFYTHGLIASDKYIDSGYGVDGIIRGDCGGTYSSWTTGSQNSWMQAAVALRGFCLDYIHDCLKEGRRFPYLNDIVSYYQSKGLDLSDEKQVRQWCEEHPNQCYSNKYQIIEMPNEEKPININTGKWTTEEKTVYLQALRNIHEIQDITHTFILNHQGEQEGKELLEALQQTLKSVQAESRVNAIGEKEYIVDVDYGVLTGSFFIQQNRKVQLFEDFEIYDENGSYYGMCDKEQLEKVLQEHEKELEKE